jgi:hypothetical protein
MIRFLFTLCKNILMPGDGFFSPSLSLVNQRVSQASNDATALDASVHFRQTSSFSLNGASSGTPKAFIAVHPV